MLNQRLRCRVNAGKIVNARASEELIFHAEEIGRGGVCEEEVACKHRFIGDGGEPFLPVTSCREQRQKVNLRIDGGKLIELCNEAQKAREQAEDKYSTLFSQVQEDRYRKDKVKILSRSIRMRGMIMDLLYDYKADKMEGCETPAAQFLQTQLKNLIDCLEADLKQEKVLKLENGIDGADFDEEHMEACGVEPTDNPELSGKVCRSVSPGYYWTLPYILKPRITDNGEEIYSYKFIISYEQVITYKYTKE